MSNWSSLPSSTCGGGDGGGERGVGLARALTTEPDLIELGCAAAAAVMALAVTVLPRFSPPARDLAAVDSLARVGDRLGGLTHGKLSCSAKATSAREETRRMGVTFCSML